MISKANNHQPQLNKQSEKHDICCKIFRQTKLNQTARANFGFMNMMHQQVLTEY